jgi:uncharacterized protein YciI
MRKLFLVTRSRGPRWDDSKPLEGQNEWTAHAELMDKLTAEGFIVLGGPVDGTRHALLVIEARDAEEIQKRLVDKDPWSHNGILRTSELQTWTVRLDST